MTFKDLIELRNRLLYMREVARDEFELEDNAFTNMWIIAADSEQTEARTKFYALHKKAGKLHDLWCKVFDAIIIDFENKIDTERKQ